MGRLNSSGPDRPQVRGSKPAPAWSFLLPAPRSSLGSSAVLSAPTALPAGVAPHQVRGHAGGKDAAAWHAGLASQHRLDGGQVRGSLSPSLSIGARSMAWGKGSRVGSCVLRDGLAACCQGSGCRHGRAPAADYTLKVAPRLAMPPCPAPAAALQLRQRPPDPVEAYARHRGRHTLGGAGGGAVRGHPHLQPAGEPRRAGGRAGAALPEQRGRPAQ